MVAQQAERQRLGGAQGGPEIVDPQFERDAKHDQTQYGVQQGQRLRIEAQVDLVNRGHAVVSSL